MDSADITSTALIVATTTPPPSIIVNGTNHINANGIDTSVSPTCISTSTSTSPKDTSTSTSHTSTIPNGHPPPFPRSKSESITTPLPTSTATSSSTTTSTLTPSLSHSSSLSSLSSHQQSSSLHIDINGTTSPIPEDLGAIDVEHIIRVIRIFAHEFIPGSNTGRTLTSLRSAQSRVNHLMSLDYHLQLISNANGEYCTTYPLDLVILENEKNGEYAAEASVHNKVNDASVLKPLMRISRFSRVHGRFVIPVILFRNKNICRSSTLSIQAEAIFNNVHAKTREFMASLYDSMSSRFTSGIPSSPPKSASFALGMESQRCADEQLLTHLSTKYICDLMVEQKKKRMGVTLTSSEKVETSRYGKFAISSIPYPGCEFFAVYKENQHIAQGLMFDWDQSYCNATLAIEHPYDWKLLKQKRHLHGHTHITATSTYTSTSTSTCSTTCDHCLYSHHLYHDAHLDWNDYKSWDLVEMTQHYLRLMIGQLTDEADPSGLLVHCVSGWDRTPLFISLLRLSLWADGEIHRSLDATQILYLTITYDWMLFSHNLPCRLEKGEDVFYFCFDFLQYITGEKYSVKYASYIRRIQAERQKATQSPPPSVPVTVPTPTPSTSSSKSSISSASLPSSTSPPIPTSFPGEIGFTHSSRGTVIISPHLAPLSHKTPSLPTLSSSPPSPKHDDDVMLQSQMAGFFNDLSDVIPTPHIPAVDTKEDGDLSLDDLYFNDDESTQHIIPVNETPRDDIEETTSTSTSISHPIPIPTRQRSVSYDESLGTSPISDKAPRKMSRCGSWQLIADALSTSPPLISIDPPPSIPPIIPTTTTSTVTTTSSSTSTAVLAWTSAQSTSSIAASDIRLSSSLSLSQLNAVMYPTLSSVMTLHTTSTLLEKTPDIPQPPSKPSQREQRLMAVRSLFQSIYPHALNRDATTMTSPTSTSHSQPSSPSIPASDRPRSQSQSQSSSHLTRSRLETTAPPTLATHVTSSPLVTTDATAAAETVKQALTTELQPISIPAATSIPPSTSHINMALPIVTPTTTTTTTDKSPPVGLLGWIPRLVGGE